MINKVLREKPADAISTISGLLISNSNKSYPVFEKFEAKKIYLLDSTGHQSLKIDVFLHY